MALIQTLQGTGELQEFKIKVRYSITISPVPGRPSKREGQGTLETLSGSPLPDRPADHQTILTLEDGRLIRIEFHGKSYKFELLGDD
jgi:hypothetical protein